MLFGAIKSISQADRPDASTVLMHFRCCYLDEFLATAIMSDNVRSQLLATLSFNLSMILRHLLDEVFLCGLGIERFFEPLTAYPQCGNRDQSIS